MGQEIVVGVIVSLLIFIVSSLIFTFPRKYIIRIYLKARKFFRKKPKTSEQQSDAQDPNKSPEEAHLDALFRTACKFVEKASSLSDEQQLTLYGLYKQATVGECTKPKPKASDIIELKKWEAWIEQKGKTNTEAKKKYVNSVESFIPGAKVSAEGGSETSEENGDDDLFMTDEEYRQRKEKNNKTSFGMKFSRPTMGSDEMNSEPVQENEADISKFFKLINKEDLKGIEKAIKAGFDLYKEDNAGMKAIHYAIENEKESVVALLCEHYTDLNTPDKAGMTPLHYAVAHEDEAIIELLLKKNVDVNKTDDEGESPLDLANAKLKKFILSLV